MIYKLELTFLLGQNYGFYEPPMASLDTITSKPSDCEYGVITNSRFKTASSPNLKNVYIESNVYFKTKPSDEEIKKFANQFKDGVRTHLKKMMEEFEKSINYWDFTDIPSRKF